MAVAPPIQKAVDALVGHHVQSLRATCVGTRCTATNDRGLVVQLVRRGSRYIVRAAIA